jgi:methionine-rich copper-binding protein CopC
VSSYPAADERVGSLPEQVLLEFDEPMRIGEEDLVIRDPRGGRHPADVLASARSDVFVAFLEPAAGQQGRWTVDYEAVSQDGHLVEGGVAFWVGADGAPSLVTDPTSLSRTVALLLVLLAGGFTVMAQVVRRAVPAR